jgi:SAM-dependent methyltransferase
VVSRDVSTFVRAGLPPPPARVLEVGAGEGALARELAEAGYDVVAIDPESTTDDVLPVPLAALDEPDGSFDAAVAVVSLHHVEPLEPSCARLAEVLRSGAPLVIDEFDVAVFDEPAAAWLLEQRHAHGHAVDKTAAELVAELRAELHPLSAITAALAPDFDVGQPRRGSYLYRWDLDDALRPVEERLIAGGALPAVGARLVATRKRRPPRA